MTPQSLVRYQRIMSRIANFQRPMYVKPLTPFHRAILASTIYANASR